MPADSTAILRTSLLYRHLDGLRLCGHVRCWFLRKADGSAGDLVVDDRAAFLEALQATGRFCQDSSKGRMLHGGHRSFREMATASGHTLHVTAAGESTCGCILTGCHRVRLRQEMGVVATGRVRPWLTFAAMSSPCRCACRPQLRKKRFRAGNGERISPEEAPVVRCGTGPRSSRPARGSRRTAAVPWRAPGPEIRRPG
jgi:hypothetical protein